MSDSVTNKELKELIIAIANPSSDASSPPSGSVYKRLGEVEQLQARHGATVESLVQGVSNLATKIDEIIAKRETKLAPIITVAIAGVMMLLSLVVAIGTLAMIPIKEDIVQHTGWNRRIRDDITTHERSASHPRMIERVDGLEKIVESVPIYFKEAVAIMRTEMILRIGPIEDKIKTMTDDRYRRTEAMSHIEGLQRGVDANKSQLEMLNEFLRNQLVRDAKTTGRGFGRGKKD